MPAAIPVLLLLAALAGLAGCRSQSYPAAYRFADGAAYTVRYVGALEAKAEGFRGSRPYNARAEAWMSIRAVPDSGGGAMGLLLTADSVSYEASDRDSHEGRYMEGRLRRYKARMALTASGRVLALDEEPDLPPVDFSPLNFGRLLIHALPAFPGEPVQEGSEWRIEQPLLDKFNPDSRIVKRFRAKGLRETPEGRLLDLEMEAEAWLEEDLGAPGAGAVPGPARPSLLGRGEAVFNLDKGVPVSADIELEGGFHSQVREPAAGDSARTVELPLRLRLRLSFLFGA